MSEIVFFLFSLSASISQTRRFQYEVGVYGPNMYALFSYIKGDIKETEANIDLIPLETDQKDPLGDMRC